VAEWSVSVIGREAERAELGEFADAIACGPAALTLEGGAGVGKTTLWLSGLELARERGCRVLATRPTAAEAGLAFAGLGDLSVASSTRCSTCFRCRRPKRCVWRSC
jgi:hypothetical protein